VKLVADFLAQDRRATREEISQAAGIPYFDKRFAEKKNLCLMGPLLLNCGTEIETPGNCNITKTKI